MNRPVSIVLLAVLTLTLARCTETQPAQSADAAQQELTRLEREWLDAYDNDDVEAMDRIVADDFTITYEDGRVVTKAETLAGLSPDEEDEEEEDDGRSHYTEDTTIRLYGNTAILTGIYVDPGDEGEPDERYRYTDTWMRNNGQWQVVASHLSKIAPPQPPGAAEEDEAS